MLKHFLAGTFYFAGVDNDWTDPQDDVRWQDGTKTLFDPCPAGWRVPESGEEGGEGSPWQAFTTANGLWESIGFGSGRRFDNSVVYGGTAWYSVPGCRHRSAQFVNVSAAGHDWSSTVDPDNKVYYFRLDENRIWHSYAEVYRAYGFSVRCIRE